MSPSSQEAFKMEQLLSLLLVLAVDIGQSRIFYFPNSRVRNPCPFPPSLMAKKWSEESGVPGSQDMDSIQNKFQMSLATLQLPVALFEEKLNYDRN